MVDILKSPSHRAIVHGLWGRVYASAAPQSLYKAVHGVLRMNEVPVTGLEKDVDTVDDHHSSGTESEPEDKRKKITSLAPKFVKPVEATIKYKPRMTKTSGQASQDALRRKIEASQAAMTAKAIKQALEEDEAEIGEDATRADVTKPLSRPKKTEEDLDDDLHRRLRSSSSSPTRKSRRHSKLPEKRKHSKRDVSEGHKTHATARRSSKPKRARRDRPSSSSDDGESSLDRHRKKSKSRTFDKLAKLFASRRRSDSSTSTSSSSPSPPPRRHRKRRSPSQSSSSGCSSSSNNDSGDHADRGRRRKRGARLDREASDSSSVSSPISRFNMPVLLLFSSTID